MKIEIEHQQQPNPVTCTSACIAMLTGIPVNKIADVFHPAYSRQEITPCEYLESRGLKVKRLYTDDQPMPSRLYLVTVPSLNKKGTLHHIIVDWRDVCDVYDPNKGIKGKKYYVSWDQDSNNDLEVELGHCIPEVEVITETSW